MSDSDLPLNEYEQRAIERGVRNIRERLCQDLCDATRERISDAALEILAGNPRNRDSALARELRECRDLLDRLHAYLGSRGIMPGRNSEFRALIRACLPGEDSDE